MSDLLNRRPDRPLPADRHAKLRANLLAAIDEEPASPKRPWLVPVAAAAAVAVVAGGLAVAVPALKNDDARTPVAGSAEIQDLTPAATTDLRNQCLDEANRITANGHHHPFRDFEVVRAVEFPSVQDPKVVNTWLVGKDRTSEYYWLCSRTAGGVISESSIRTPQTQRLGGDPVRSVARNAGIYAGPVDRVTVQVPGQPEKDAFLVDGFWFAATEGRTGWGPYDADDPLRNAYVVRGYAADGRQVYVSTKPTSNCYVLEPPRPGTRQAIPTNLPRCRTVYNWPS